MECNCVLRPLLIQPAATSCQVEARIRDIQSETHLNDNCSGCKGPTSSSSYSEIAKMIAALNNSCAQQLDSQIDEAFRDALKTALQEAGCTAADAVL
jgi:hypothetical protein